MLGVFYVNGRSYLGPTFGRVCEVIAEEREGRKEGKGGRPRLFFAVDFLTCVRLVWYLC